MTDTAEAPEVTEEVQATEQPNDIESKDFSFVLDKYKTEDRSEEEAAFEQAKAYTELQGKFGAFTGAPDEYSIELPEEMAEAIDLEQYADDPILGEAKELSKELGINNDAFNKLVGIYFKGQMADVEALEVVKAEEMKALGSNANRRLENISDWAKANLDIENAEALAGTLTSAKSVEAVEALIAKTRNVAQNQEGQSAPSIDHDKLKEMMAAKDEYGNSKMNDPEYAAKVRKLYGQAFGEEPRRIKVG